MPAQAEDIIGVYRLALENDPQYQGAGFKNRASKEVLNQAYSRFLPTMGAEGTHVETIQDIVSSDNTLFAQGKTDFASRNYTLSLTQPVFRYADIVGLGQAKAALKRSNTEFELARQQMLTRVASAYMSTLSAKDMVAFAKAEKAAVEMHHEIAASRHKMGLVPISDLYDARARLASVNAQLEEAESSLDDAVQGLVEITGGPVAELKELREKLPLKGPEPDDAEVWVEAALKQNAGLMIQRHQVEVGAKEVERQKSGHYPTFDVIGRMNRQNTDGTLFGGGSAVDTKEVVFKLSVPIFEGGLIVFRTREAIQLYKKAQQDHEQTKRAVVREARAAFNGVKTAIGKVEALQKSVEAQSLVVEMREEGFRSGLYTSLAVLDAMRDLYLYKKDHAQSRYDYILNSLRLRQAVGTLSEDDLAMVNEWLM